MLCSIQITLFRFHGLLETTFFYLQILENVGYVHSISFDSIRSDVTSQFRFPFFFFLFTVSLPLMFVNWFEVYFPLRSSLCLKTEHPRKSLDSCPLSFLLNDHVRKKKKAGGRRKGNNGGNDGEMKERNGWGKDPRENRRTGSWPTAAFCPLFPSLIGARYLLLPFTCMGKKERKEWTKAIDIVNDRIFLRHHSSINPHIIWFFQLYVLFDSLRGFIAKFGDSLTAKKMEESRWNSGRNVVGLNVGNIVIIFLLEYRSILGDFF